MVFQSFEGDIMNYSKFPCVLQSYYNFFCLLLVQKLPIGNVICWWPALMPLSPSGWLPSQSAVQNCCKGDSPCQWNDPIFRPSEIEPIDIKLDMGDYVGDLIPHANFGISALTGSEAAYAWYCHHPCLFFTPCYFLLSWAPARIVPFDRFSCFMA